jgi:hypothetical protein
MLPDVLCCCLSFRIFKITFRKLISRFLIFVYCTVGPSCTEKTCKESSDSDPRGFLLTKTSFCNSLTSWISVATF